MSLLGMAILLAGVVAALAPPIAQEKKLHYAQQAEFDSQGNIYVNSDEGKLIKMGDTKHCSMALVANDRQTVGCFVAQWPVPARLEIYLWGGHKTTIEVGAQLQDWHFWRDGKQVSVCLGPSDGPGICTLYDAASGRIVERLAEPLDESLLPQWAKSQAEIQDESVPMSAALMQQRTMWVAKVLRQIGKIKPGMRRKDLLKIFEGEGGLSNRLQRTYVSVECGYIKVDVRFKAANDEKNYLKEDPDDIIESISRPYLGWAVLD